MHRDYNLVLNFGLQPTASNGRASQGVIAVMPNELQRMVTATSTAQQKVVTARPTAPQGVLTPRPNTQHRMATVRPTVPQEALTPRPNTQQSVLTVRPPAPQERVNVRPNTQQGAVPVKQTTQQSVVQMRPTTPRGSPKSISNECSVNAPGQKVSRNVTPISSNKAHSATAMTSNPAFKTTGVKPRSNSKPQPAQSHKVQGRPSVQSSMVSSGLKMNQSSNYEEDFPVIIFNTVTYYSVV